MKKKHKRTYPKYERENVEDLEKERREILEKFKPKEKGFFKKVAATILAKNATADIDRRIIASKKIREFNSRTAATRSAVELARAQRELRELRDLETRPIKPLKYPDLFEI